MKRLTMALAFLVLGCSQANNHPKVGDWYEEIPTGERVKVVALGSGTELLGVYHTFKRMSDTSAVANFTIFAFLGDSITNVREDCVLYKERKTTDAYGGLTFHELYSMTPKKQFGMDYRLVKTD